MPIIYKQDLAGAKKTAVWEITEPKSFFEGITLPAEDRNRSEKRQLEKLCCAHLLDLLCGKGTHLGMRTDEYGKPYLRGSDISLSFSHSRNLIACQVNPDGPDSGIDIEYRRPNIRLLSAKYTTAEDNAPLEGDDRLQLIWGAKEVLYKIHGKKGLDFKRDLRTAYDDRFTGKILSDPDIEKIYELGYARLGDFFLVWNQ